MKTPAIVGMLSLLFTVTSIAQQTTITVVPELTDEILAIRTLTTWTWAPSVGGPNGT